jgi:hypothetical protein
MSSKLALWEAVVLGLVARWRWAVVMLALALLGGASVASAQVDPLMFGGDDPVRAGAEQRWAGQFAEWRRLRQSESAREDRFASRSRFGSLSRAEAIALAQDTFPELLNGNLGPATEFANGVRVGERLDEFTSRLETATGKPAGLKMSTQPMAIEEGGKLVGVDLDVHADEDGFGADQPAAAVELPATSADPVVWEQDGIELQAGRSDDSTAVLRDDRLFYVEGAGTDADYALVPTDAGVQVIWQLRSAAAPEVFRMSFELPEGARLEAVRQPGLMKFLGARIVGADGQVIQDITAPIVADADGTNIAAQTTVEGDDMVITVRHRGLDLRYPLMIDPVVETWSAGGGFASCGANATGGSWSYTQNSSNTPYTFSCWGEGGHGLYVAQANGGYYNQGSTGYWYWNARTDSYIQSVAWNGSRHVTAYDMYGLTGYSLFYAGIWSPGCCWRAYDQWGHSAHYSWTQNANANADNTQAVLGIITNGGTGNYYDGGIAGLDGASITVNDNYAPTNVALVSFTPGLQSSSIGSPYRESVWHDMNLAPPSMSAQAQDRGLGLQKISLNDSLNRWVLWTGLNSTCTGLKNWNCPTTLQTTAQSAATTMWQLPQGITEARPAAADVTGKVSYGTPINLKNDTSAPGVTLSGPMWDQRDTPIGTESISLHLKATDGSQDSLANRRSGVKKVEIYVDGEFRYSTASQACAADSCPMEFDWTLSLDDLSGVDGAHEVKAIAEDQLGHRSPGTIVEPYFDHGDADVRSYAATPPADAYLGDASTESVTCVPSTTMYCGQSSGSNTRFQAVMSDPPLVDSDVDASGEPIATSARVAPGDWGLSDEHADMHDRVGPNGQPLDGDPGFERLGITKFRKIVPWDLAAAMGYVEPAKCKTRNPDGTLSDGPFNKAKTQMTDWYNALKDHGYELMVSFQINKCYSPDTHRKKPMSTFLTAANEFRKQYPQVTVYTAWNEPNGSKQPWSGISRAGDAGRLFNQLRRACDAPIMNGTTQLAPTCVVVAGDFSEKGLKETYVNAYKDTAGLRGVTHPWAIHPYEATYFETRQRGYLAFLKATKGPVWLTEAGAFHHKYRTVPTNSPRDNASAPPGDGREYLAPPADDDYTPNITRQFNDLQFLLDRIVPYKYNGVARVTRLHYYQWADRDETHGSGLVRDLGTANEAKGRAYCLFLHRDKTAAVRNATCDETP